MARTALQGQRSLEDVVAILRQISGILESGYTTEQFQVDVRTYVKRIETIYHYHSIVGVPLQGDEDTRPELDAIYVPLRIALQDSARTQKPSPDALIPLLEQAPYLVLLGGPGFGKSTMTRSLARRHAEANMIGASALAQKKAMILSGEPIPLRIELRPFAEAQKQHPSYNFLSYTTEVLLAREGISSIKVQMFEELLKRRLMLLLFDGLDEVPELKERRELIDQIERFAWRYPGNRIVVTSRPVGYENASFSRLWFKHGMIQEFNHEQIYRFLEGFYTHVLKYSLFSSEARKEQETFYKSLKDNPRLYKLARNPLLLTVAAALFHAERLPEKRVQLYEKCADLLLNKWAKLRSTDARWKDMRMSKDDQRACLAHIGFVLHGKSQDRKEDDEIEAMEGISQSTEDSATDVSARFLIQEIVHFLRNVTGNLSVDGPKAEAELFLELVKEEAGLIVERGKDEDDSPLYGFVHRTFQEYFAAIDVDERYQEEQDPSIISEFLKNHVHDPHWREVILLLFGKLKRKPATIQLRQILEGESRRSTYSNVIQQDLFFVCDCLANETPVVDDFAGRILSRLGNLVEESPFPSQRREALNALGTLVQTSEYAERARQQLSLFVERRIELDIATRIEAALVLYINSQDETEQLEILQKLLDMMEHSGISFGSALRSTRTLYEYGSSRSEIRHLAVPLLLSLAQSPSLSFEQARQMIEALHELNSFESEVEQQAAQFLLTFARRSDLPFEQVIQAVEALYRYCPAGSEARQQTMQLLLALIQQPDFLLEQVIQVTKALYRYTASDSQERHQATEKLVALTQRPDLPVEQGIQLVEFFHKNSGPRSQERRQATEKLVALTQRADLSLEQVIQGVEAFYHYTASDSEERRQATEKLVALTQRADLSSEQRIRIHEFFFEYSSARSEERSLTFQRIEELTHQSNVSFEQIIQVYEFFYESSSASAEDRRRATQHLEELAGGPHLSVEQVISIAEFFSKSSRSGPREEQMAIQLLVKLIRRSGLFPEQMIQAVEALYRYSPAGAADERQAIQYLVELIQRSDLSTEQMIQAIEALYRLDAYDVREQRLAVQQLVALLTRPTLPPEQALEAASILYKYSIPESKEREYALEVIRQCILKQSVPIEQRLQAAAVPLTVREHNYADRVAAVQMVLTLIQGEAAKKYLAEKWEQHPSRDHRLSPLRENRHRHAFVTHLPTIYELASLDILSPEIRDEMYSILRATVPQFGDVGTVHQ